MIDKPDSLDKFKIRVLGDTAIGLSKIIKKKTNKPTNTAIL